MVHERLRRQPEAEVHSHHFIYVVMPLRSFDNGLVFPLPLSDTPQYQLQAEPVG